MCENVGEVVGIYTGQSLSGTVAELGASTHLNIRFDKKTTWAI